MDAALLILVLFTLGMIAWERAGHVRETHRRARTFDAQSRKRIGL